MMSFLLWQMNWPTVDYSAMMLPAKLKRKLQTVRDLSWSDRLFVLQAWFLLLFIELSLRLMPLSKVHRMASGGRNFTAVAQKEKSFAELEHAAQLTNMAAQHHLTAMTCLRRSLALQWHLTMQGIATELRIGVEKETQDLHAHAWLEFHGRPINEQESTLINFTPIVNSDSWPQQS